MTCFGKIIATTVPIIAKTAFIKRCPASISRRITDRSAGVGRSGTPWWEWRWGREGRARQEAVLLRFPLPVTELDPSHFFIHTVTHTASSLKAVGARRQRSNLTVPNVISCSVIRLQHIKMRSRFFHSLDSGFKRYRIVKTENRGQPTNTRIDKLAS